MIKDLPSLFVGFSAVALFGVLLTGGQIDETAPATAEKRAPQSVNPAPRLDSGSVNGPEFAVNTLSSRLP